MKKWLILLPTVIARSRRGRSNPESQRKPGLLRSCAPRNDDLIFEPHKKNPLYMVPQL